MIVDIARVFTEIHYMIILETSVYLDENTNIQINKS